MRRTLVSVSLAAMLPAAFLAWAGCLAWGASPAGTVASPQVARPSPCSLAPDTTSGDGERLAWLIWGRRGRSKHVTPLTIGWPVGRSWPADGRNVSTWGEVQLASKDAVQGAESGLLIAPLDERGTGCNGILGADEWNLDNALVLDTPAGALIVAAKWDGYLLSVVAALPAVADIIGRSEVVLTVAPERASAGLPQRSRACLIGWDGRLHVPTLQWAEVGGRSWRWRDVTEDVPIEEAGFRGALSMSGDGGLPFVVAEYTVRLASLVDEPRQGLRLPLAVFFTNLPPTHECADVLRWPWGRGAATDFNDSLLSEHPDGWGAARWGARPRNRTELPLPELAQSPVPDGRIAEQEWQGAAILHDDFLRDGTCEVRAGISEGRLFLGFSCRTLRRGVTTRALEIYADPAGDGGLLPRPDDRLIILGAEQGARPMILRWEPPASAAVDKIVTPEGQWVEPSPSRSEGMVQTNGDRIVAEAAVPLSELGLSQENPPQSLGLMLRLIYDSRLTIEEKGK